MGFEYFSELVIILIFWKIFKVYSKVETALTHKRITYKNLYNIMKQLKKCISTWKIIITPVFFSIHMVKKREVKSDERSVKYKPY